MREMVKASFTERNPIPLGAVLVTAAAAAAAAVYKVASGLLAPTHSPPQRREEPDEAVPPALEPVDVGEITEEELRQYDGSNPKKPLLMAIKGRSTTSPRAVSVGYVEDLRAAGTGMGINGIQNTLFIKWVPRKEVVPKTSIVCLLFETSWTPIPIPYKGPKHRSHKKLMSSGCHSFSREQDGFYRPGRKYNECVGDGGYVNPMMVVLFIHQQGNQDHYAYEYAPPTEGAANEGNQKTFSSSGPRQIDSKEIRAHLLSSRR